MLKHNSYTLYKTILLASLLLTYTSQVNANILNGAGFYIATGKSDITANEIVYSNNYKVSHLTWKTQNAATSIFGIKHEINDYMTLNFEAQSLSQQTKSVMDDYDWLYTNTSDWSDWSHHEDTLLTQADSYTINASFTLAENKNGYFSVIAGYKKDTRQWKSFGGSYVYSNTTFRDSSGNFTPGSAAIDYKQEYTTPYYGLDLGALFDNWLYTLQIGISNNVQLVATDVHHARNLIFIDKFAPGRMENYKLGISYFFNDNVAINFSHDLRNFIETRGNTVQTSTVTGKVTGSCNNCAGADNSSKTSTLALSLFF